MPPRRPDPTAWRPTRIRRVVESYDTSMGTTKIETDAGTAYIKVLGNRQGPHALVAELVGSALARWFGLSVPDFAILKLSAAACFDLPRGARAQPGPAFVSRHVPGRTWGGSAPDLDNLTNPEDVARLVVFDTWVRNCDRHPPDLAARKPNYANVYLADTERVGRRRLLAIDHTHCFDCGRDLSERLSDIEKVRDERAYGLFPAFVRFLAPGPLTWSGATLRSLTGEVVGGVLSQVPAEWEVSAPVRAALTELIRARAVFLADRIDAGWPPRPQP